MSFPTQKIDYNGRKIVFTWIKDVGGDWRKYSPITQAYGVCFNLDGETLISNQNDHWTLPGGHPEGGELIEESLRREVLEETDVTLDRIKFLGVQRVDDPDNPDGNTLYYQSRWIALVDKVLPQTIDPAKGKIHERKFVPMSEITSYITWGSTGNKMFKDAIESFKHL